MTQVAATEEFKSQMTFLKTYERNYQLRKKQIEALKNNAEELKPQVEVYEAIQEEIKSLKSQNKTDEEFLVSMNEMVLRSTGEPISQGPLFEEKTN
jgi:prefoldin subunit 5